MAHVKKVNQVRALVEKLTAEVMGRDVRFIVARDCRNLATGRLYIQCWYMAPNTCRPDYTVQQFRGRKWYLSDYMTDDEVVKTCYAAFKAAVEHEVMEGFRYEGQRVFNPHADFRSLMEAGKKEIYRKPQ